MPVGAARAGVFGGGVAIPDADLAHWYDATEIIGSDGDAIGTWTDQEGTDDLTQATSSKKPTLRTGELNGNAMLEFDGSDDVLTNTLGTNLTQPNTYFLVYRFRTDPGANNRGIYDDDTATEQNFGVRGDNGNLRLNAGVDLNSGISADTADHIHTGVFDGANSVIRQDGTELVTGDAGTGDLTGMFVGAQGDETSHSEVDIGEFLAYDAGLSTSDRDDVESYLSDKWGIPI